MIATIKSRLRRPNGKRTSFRARYQELERQRAAMIERIHSLGDKARAHPAYGRALTLLNQTFRKATVTQRLAILKSAGWLIDVLETLTLMN